MRQRTILAATEDFTVARVDCAASASRGWSAPEPAGVYGLVVARRGAFACRARGREALIDATVAYLERPGVETEFAHPAQGGDTCISITLSAALLASLAGGDPDLDRDTLPVGAQTDLALRRLVATAGGGDREDTAEPLVGLIADLVAAGDPRRPLSGRPSTVGARRRLVDDARLALQERPTIGLVELARTIGSSPHHLSRLFGTATGMSVTAYRRRLRVQQALDRLAQGERDLAALASELGFADHAHLTRTVRSATGDTPAQLRRTLARAQGTGPELPPRA